MTVAHRGRRAGGHRRPAPAAPAAARRRARVPPVVWVFLLVPLRSSWSGSSGRPSTASSSSFTKWNGVGAAEPVGLENYVNLFDDPVFQTALKNNVIWVVGFGGLSVIGGLRPGRRAEQAAAAGSASTAAPIYLPMVVLAGRHRAVLAGACTSPTAPINAHARPASASSTWQHQWLADPDTALWAILVAAVWRQVGYIMVLYLAGLKGCDPTPGGGGRGRRRQPRGSGSGCIVMPQLRGREHGGLRGHGDRLAAHLRHRLGDDPRRPVRQHPAAQHLHVPAGLHRGEPRATARPSPWSSSCWRSSSSSPTSPARPGGGLTMTLHPAVAAAPTTPRRPGPPPPATAWLFHVVMTPVTLLWIAPLVFVVFVVVRSFDDIASHGLGALPASFSLEASAPPGRRPASGSALRNSVVVTRGDRRCCRCFLSSLAAFALSRYHIPFRRTILLIMLAGNLLPPQILLIPVAEDLRGPRHLRHPHRADRRPGRLRARLLHLRAARLHARPARRGLRGRQDRRRRRPADLRHDRAAAVPAGAGRARRPGDAPGSSTT